MYGGGKCPVTQIRRAALSEASRSLAVPMPAPAPSLEATAGGGVVGCAAASWDVTTGIRARWGSVGRRGGVPAAIDHRPGPGRVHPASSRSA